MKTEAMICLDIGGTNLRIGLVDRSCRLTNVQIVSTAAITEGGSVEGLIALIGRYMEKTQQAAAFQGISLGVPATVDRVNGVVLQAPNVPGLDNQQIGRRLGQAFSLPVWLEKDVNLLLTYDLMEQRLPQDGLIIGIYFGTGIGNSICWHGQLLSGKNGVCGELGHVPQLGSCCHCGCGNVGCLEPLGGGRRLEELCRTVFPDTPVAEIYTRHADAPEVRAQVDAMAVAVATEVNILDPDYVVIGGGVPQIRDFPKDYFLERVRFHTRKPYPMENLDIRFARPNQENGIIGAGICGWKRLRSEQETAPVQLFPRVSPGKAL